MKRRTLLPALVLIVSASACVENTAPGNDREASLEPPPTAAELASASAALENVATEILYPQQITTADRRNLPVMEDRCIFRYTEVGFPIFVYGPATGVLKLNGKLVPLPARGDGVYAEGPVSVTIRPLDDREDELFGAEFVLRLESAPNELGFHGFSGC